MFIRIPELEGGRATMRKDSETQELPDTKTEHLSGRGAVGHDSSALAVTMDRTISESRGPSSKGSATQANHHSIVVNPRRVRKAATKLDSPLPEDEPLVDTTAALALRSKKTARLERRQQKKQARKVQSDVQSFLDLPQEMVSLILSFLQPSDIFGLLRLNHSMRMFILANERSLAESITGRRYWVLRQCFPLPMTLEKVPDSARPGLLSEQWQERLRIHKTAYQHIKQIDALHACTCMSCVLAWNNICIVLDLAHWQHNLDNREPLPIIPRGRNPEWNIELLDQHAQIATKAMSSPLAYARILQIHLDVTSRTVIRSGKWRKKGEKLMTPKPRLYHLTDAEAAAGTDAYLERSGPPSYQPIYMRDNYYSVEAFVPNRKWDKEEQRWHYYSKWPRPHETDLAWLVARFTPKT